MALALRLFPARDHPERAIQGIRQVVAPFARRGIGIQDFALAHILGIPIEGKRSRPLLLAVKFVQRF